MVVAKNRYNTMTVMSIADREGNKKHHEWINKVIHVSKNSFDSDCKYLWMYEPTEDRTLRSSTIVSRKALDEITFEFTTLNSVYILGYIDEH